MILRRNWNLAGRIYPIVQPLLKRVRRSRWAIRRIFGVRVPATVQVQFDPVTVLLAKFLPDLIAELIADRANELGLDHPPLRILEMGIGEGALVTLSLANSNLGKFDLHLDGVDCSPSRLASSLKTATFNQVDCRFWLSDLFESVASSPLYDIIFFNPPYVPTETGRSLQLTKRLGIDGDQMWDGGDDGTDLMRRFLSEGKALVAPGGLMVFGVQPIFVNDDTVGKVITQCGHQLQRRFTRKGVPAVAYAVNHH